MRNHSYENDFDLHEHETACRTHFHMKGFSRRLIVQQRHRRTRKWPFDTSTDIHVCIIFVINMIPNMSSDW